MSTEKQPEDYPASHEQKRAEFCYEVMEQLQELAGAYSSDYAEEITDGVSAERSWTDVGGELETDMFFTAERVREELCLGGRTVVEEFKAGSHVKVSGLLHNDLLESIRQIALDEIAEHFGRTDEGYDDEAVHHQAEEFLADPSSDISLSFETLYALSTDGSFISEQNLILYVGGCEIDLPPDAAADIDESIQPTSYDADSLAELESCFDAVELEELRSMASIAIAEIPVFQLEQRRGDALSTGDVVRLFYARMSDMGSHPTSSEQLRRMVTLAKEVFAAD